MLFRSGWLSDLFVNGILAGLGGILVFIPQIMILFGLITILEDTGYMARISFLSDKLMRKVGLNGKSVMPMISGFACAVPAIMSARNIENKKERLITIRTTAHEGGTRETDGDSGTCRGKHSWRTLVQARSLVLTHALKPRKPSYRTPDLR